MNVVGGTADRQGWNSVLACDAAEIGMKPFPHVVPDPGPSLRGSKHHVNQTTYVTVRHAFSRPFRDLILFVCKCTQDCRPGLLSGRPFGTKLQSRRCYPAPRKNTLRQTEIIRVPALRGRLIVVESSPATKCGESFRKLAESRKDGCIDITSFIP